jgi:hypothetical protein
LPHPERSRSSRELAPKAIVIDAAAGDRTGDNSNPAAIVVVAGRPSAKYYHFMIV